MSAHWTAAAEREARRRYPDPDPPPLRIRVRRSLWATAAGWYTDPQIVAAYRARAEGRAR